jgi:hypothetical protein
MFKLVVRLSVFVFFGFLFWNEVWHKRLVDSGELFGGVLGAWLVFEFLTAGLKYGFSRKRDEEGWRSHDEYLEPSSPDYLFDSDND